VNRKKWVIGDIRGDFLLLQKLMDKLGPGEGDVLIFLGSYLGPAPYSKEVVQYLLESKNASAAIFLFLKGCYEFMFQRVIGSNPAAQDIQTWTQMGGERVFRSYASQSKLVVMTGTNGHRASRSVEIPLQIPEPHIRFMEQGLHQWFEDDTYPFIASHSGSHPGIHGLKGREEESVFSAGSWYLDDRFTLPGKTILFSHVPFQKPFIEKGRIGIDLGAGLGGKLCCFDMVSQTFTIVGG